jgi:hypothetical protein
MVVSCCHYHQFIEFGFSARAETLLARKIIFVQTNRHSAPISVLIPRREL